MVHLGGVRRHSLWSFSGPELCLHLPYTVSGRTRSTHFYSKNKEKHDSLCFQLLTWCTWEESTATPFGRSRGRGCAFILPIRSAAELVRLYFIQKIKKSMIFHAFNFLLGAPGRSRTPGTCLRRALLYPSELQVQGLLLYEFYTSERLLSTC